MSIECGECEQDLRGGHAPGCSRAKPPFTHTGHKSYDEIKAQCKQLGLTLRDNAYNKQGSDFIVVEGCGGRAYYNTTTGNFFGTTDTGVEFDNEKTTHDHEPWFQQLLDFFLVGRKTEVPS